MGSTCVIPTNQVSTETSWYQKEYAITQLSFETHDDPVESFSGFGWKIMVGPLKQAHCSLNKYWKRSAQRACASSRLIESYSKRYDIFELGHSWLSYDGFTVRHWGCLIRFFVVTQSILNVDHLQDTWLEASYQELLKKVWCFWIESFLIKLWRFYGNDH